jgi:hypothetical protein
MDPVTVGILGRLLFMIGEKVLDHVMGAESDEELDTGAKKKAHVKEKVVTQLEEEEIRPRSRDEKIRPPLTQREIALIKELVANKVDEKIDKTVDTLNQKGIFKNGQKDTD